MKMKNGTATRTYESRKLTARFATIKRLSGPKKMRQSATRRPAREGERHAEDQQPGEGHEDADRDEAKIVIHHCSGAAPGKASPEMEDRDSEEQECAERERGPDDARQRPFRRACLRSGVQRPSS